LKDFFADITNPILDSGGEIYQYLGDGIIIAWIHHGDERDSKCVDCFFEMKKEIGASAEKYQNKFGVIPQFKAGLHSGGVVVGEIGIIKRDITYSGDVLNTTARIQSMCHELKSEVLISNDLLPAFYSLKNYATTSVGAIRLRGKEKEVVLSSIEVS
jgi:adenylate cyclase